MPLIHIQGIQGECFRYLKMSQEISPAFVVYDAKMSLQKKKKTNIFTNRLLAQCPGINLRNLAK